MEAIPIRSGNERWDKFVELSDRARATLRLSDAVRSGHAYRAWCLDEDVSFEPLTRQQIALWHKVIEWAGALSRGVPDASTELCVARGRFVHSFYVKGKGNRYGQGETSQGDKTGQGGQDTKAKKRASSKTY